MTTLDRHKYLTPDETARLLDLHDRSPQSFESLAQLPVIELARPSSMDSMLDLDHRIVVRGQRRQEVRTCTKDVMPQRG